ncbi:hypothetical protein AMTR_s00043p00171510 [Amborella trichopoda]|uniref:Uncharacterized protein n=1 Tax=Amborella trichopoda TaxID=13333 RepID=W1PXY2_AMBTC|nr:hypothetical protein AMTR_s00043p00171510 [Amborella trichopoda]
MMVRRLQSKIGRSSTGRLAGARSTSRRQEFGRRELSHSEVPFRSFGNHASRGRGFRGVQGDWVLDSKGYLHFSWDQIYKLYPNSSTLSTPPPPILGFLTAVSTPTIENHSNSRSTQASRAEKPSYSQVLTYSSSPLPSVFFCLCPFC